MRVLIMAALAKQAGLVPLTAPEVVQLNIIKSVNW